MLDSEQPYGQADRPGQRGQRHSPADDRAADDSAGTRAVFELGRTGEDVLDPVGGLSVGERDDHRLIERKGIHRGGVGEPRPAPPVVHNGKPGAAAGKRFEEPVRPAPIESGNGSGDRDAPTVAAQASLFSRLDTQSPRPSAAGVNSRP